MAWERRRNGRLYYYRVRREGDRVAKEYVGTGEAGRRAAEADQAARDARREAAQRRKEQGRPVSELSACLDELGRLTDLLVACHLLTHGWKQHHRQWRAPTNGRARSHNRTA